MQKRALKKVSLYATGHFARNKNIVIMNSVSEQSFGARLRRLQDAAAFIKTWPVYNPPRKEEQIHALDALIARAISDNQKEQEQKIIYNAAVLERQALFSGSDTSVQKMIIRIKAAVESQFGKKHAAYTEVTRIISKMREAKLIKLPPDAGNPDKAKTISTSEQSFGAKTKDFSDIITTLQGTAGYASATAALSVDNLLAMVKSMHTANDNVATQLQIIKTCRSSRLTSYADIEETSRRIKAYAKSEYGPQSKEYKSLMTLKL